MQSPRACTTKEEAFLEQCDTCSGFGHNSKQCPTPTTPTEQACLAVVEEALISGVEEAKLNLPTFEEQYDSKTNLVGRS